jgi:anaerobic C4-dicarboxylate transporter
MDIAAVVIVILSVVLTAAVVIGLFIWAAVKDGEEDKAVQKRLGIRRKTRLGR